MEDEEGLQPDREPLSPPQPPSPAGFMRWGLLFYGAMAAVAVVWRIGLYGEPILFTDAEASLGGLRLTRDALLGVAVGGAIVGLSQLTTRRTAWGQRLARALAEGLGAISTPNALLLALASGMAEELFFRGALQPRVGLVAASLLFGALHFVPRREFLPWTGFAVAAGFVFGALFEGTGNLVAPMVAHAVVNGVNLPLLIREYASPGDRARS
ncbi:MAG: type II CAAX endopeptidase family protein [Proteobacteria bacterium]|nr:type II CAAX endopeptidase family protein [Pseudomonadota bacterium]